MAMVRHPRRFSICQLVSPPGNHRRLVLVISPDEMNHYLTTLLISPMTTKMRHWPTRVPVHFEDRDGEIALERIHTIGRGEVEQVLGQVPAKTARQVAETLVAMFTL